MHHPSIRTLGRSLPAFGLSLLLLAGCTEEKDSNPDPVNPGELTTGLTGSDNVGTIPQKVRLSNSLTNTTLPGAADILAYIPPVGDQGQYGTCVAWAVGYNAKTALEGVKFSLTRDQLSSASYQLSPTDLFFNIDDNLKGASDCNGTNFTPALDVIQQRGIATMAVAPYTGLGNCSKANANTAWNSEAAKHKITAYRRLDFAAGPNVVKQEIVNKNPVILGAKLADNFMTWNSDAVYSSHSSFDNVGQHSYHAMCIVGYDDAKRAFKVVNSWAPNWGDNGFIWVDYDFMFGGFAFNQNLFTAQNDNQQPQPGPNPNPNPNPAPAGVDLIPWVYGDINVGTGSDPSLRYMEYDIFNLGAGTANVSANWQYAYIFYNAYDADDYGLVFLNTLDPSEPANATSFNCNSNASECRFNVSVPSNNSIAYTLDAGSSDPYLYQQYRMPTSLNGDYYLIMVADVTNKFNEQDEDNNIFYVTDQYPTTFVNGVGRKGAEGADPLAFKNPLKGKLAVKSAEAARFRTAVKPHNLNAYSVQEVLGMLGDRVQSGDFAKKVNAYRMSDAAKTNHGGVAHR